MDPLRQDIAYAVRKLVGSLGFALTAIVTLALGIGANTAIFSLVDALFLSPPAAVAGERLVGVVAREGERLTTQQLTWADYQTFLTHGRSLDAVAAHGRAWIYLRRGDAFHKVVGSEVTGSYFPLLGLAPARGRMLGPHDATPGAAPVAVISHALWRRMGGGDATHAADALIGSSVHVGQVITLAERTRLSHGGAALLGSLLGTTAVLALLLSSLGIYAVIAFAVRRRRREIGIRGALGARPVDLVRLVAGQGLRLAAAGVAIGVLGALAGTRALAASLLGVDARDPWIFGASALFLLEVAGLASYLPARRAAALEASAVLRCE